MTTQVAERMNRTGASTTPEEAQQMVEATHLVPPSSSGGAQALSGLRSPYIEMHASIGSMPSSGTAHPLLMDKLGERLAFERSGVRLYEALLSKLQAMGQQPGGPSEGDLHHLMQEEHEHFRMVSEAIVQMGGDPTVVTPCADVTGVASSGIVQVITDPRTTMSQCLDAMLTAELTDNDAWTMLITLAESMGQAQMVSQFQRALNQEQEHLTKVRGWLMGMAQAQMGR